MTITTVSITSHDQDRMLWPLAEGRGFRTLERLEENRIEGFFVLEAHAFVESDG